MISNIKPLMDLGFSIHLLRAKSKIPLQNNWSKLPNKTLKQLKSEYKSGMNIGVRPGEPSRLRDGTYLAIIDCDVKSEEPSHRNELKKALAGLLPEWDFAPRVISGRNMYSMHLYCKTKIAQGRFQLAESAHRVKTLMPSKVPTEADKKALSKAEIAKGYRMARAWEITLMGTGSQVVLPPSIHPDSGKPYAWLNEPTDASELPLIDFKKPQGSLLRHKNSDSHVKFVKWDIMDLIEAGVSGPIVELITRGSGMDKYNHDRSAAIFAAINALENAKLSEDLILSILTDPENRLSEKALEKGSRGAGARWLRSQLGKVKEEKAQSLANFEVIEPDMEYEDPMEEDESETRDFYQRLQKTNNGLIKNTAFNRYLILSESLIPETLCYNDFFQGVFYRQDPPWKRAEEDSFIDKEIASEHLTRIRVWLSKFYGFEASEEDIYKSIVSVSKEFSFHPVREYLKGLKWDGKNRLDMWLKTYLEAEGPLKYIQAVGRKTLVGAVARVFKPGCKFDTVLILEGDQGIGKSRAVETLGGEWYSAPAIDPKNKDSISNIQNCWIIEMAEMVPAHKSDAEALKEYITKATDRARLPFERKADDYPRQCIFIGTTNRYDYLQDETGNRRFWPVKVGRGDIEALIDDRDQLWAEAVVRFQNGEKLYLEDASVAELAKKEQAERLYHDVWENSVLEIISKMDSDFILLEEVYLKLQGARGEILDAGVVNFNKADQQRLGKILTKLGFEKTRKLFGTIRKKGWKKPISEKGGTTWGQ